MLRDYCGISTRLASPFAWPPPQMLSTSTSKPQNTSLYLTRCSIIKSQVNDSLACACHLAAIYSMVFIAIASCEHAEFACPCPLSLYIHCPPSLPSPTPLPCPFTSPHLFYPPVHPSPSVCMCRCSTAANPHSIISAFAYSDTRPCTCVCKPNCYGMMVC